MDWIKTYILSIVAVGAITGICISLIPKNTPAGTIIKMLGGMIMAITLISPLVKIRFDGLTDVWDRIRTEGDDLAKEGSESSQESVSLVIKENLESYILDKADALGLTIRVTIQMDPQNTVMPQTVEIRGAASPYQKKQMATFLKNELGIAEAYQVWN